MKERKKEKRRKVKGKQLYAFAIYFQGFRV